MIPHIDPYFLLFDMRLSPFYFYLILVLLWGGIAWSERPPFCHPPRLFAVASSDSPICTFPLTPCKLFLSFALSFIESSGKLPFPLPPEPPSPFDNPFLVVPPVRLEVPLPVRGTRRLQVPGPGQLWVERSYYDSEPP